MAAGLPRQLPNTVAPCCVAGLQRGQLANLDYLLFLNLASGRSFNDLSQASPAGCAGCKGGPVAA